MRGHQAEAAQRPHQRCRIAGQPCQATRERHRLPSVFLAARNIGLQQHIAAGILVRILQQFGQGQRIAQAQVEALRTQRMDGLRGIAQQHRAFTGQCARQHLDERVSAARAGFEQPTGTPADRILQALQPGRIVQRHHRIGLIAGHAMHGAEVAVTARQQGGRAGIGEALPGGASAYHEHHE